MRPKEQSDAITIGGQFSGEAKGATSLSLTNVLATKIVIWDFLGVTTPTTNTSAGLRPTLRFVGLQKDTGSKCLNTKFSR
jgi:hypothetical protein